MIGGIKMQIEVLSVTICRHTGKELKREIKEVREVDEDEFYRPLVEVFGDAFLEHCKNSKEA